MTPRLRVNAAVLVAMIAGLCAATSAAQRPIDTYTTELCMQADPATDNCKSGGGAQTPGGAGTGKVPHTGWPKIDGIFWQVTGDGRDARRFRGGDKSDELLGHHGDDTILGGDKSDVLWADWDPNGNTKKQKDVLSGGDGNDFLYASHGRNTMRGGKGKDLLYAFYGKGTIDCGPGHHDTAQVRTNGAYKVRNCENIKHFCAFGSDANGGCKKPSSSRARRARSR
jgi:hypothetical protein